MSSLADFYSFKARSSLSAESYLLHVRSTAACVLTAAVEAMGAPSLRDNWYDGLVDFVNEVSLADNDAVREVFAFSPNLLKLRKADAIDAIESAKLAKSDIEFVEDALGQMAYRIFEQDLWDAMEVVFVERYGADLLKTLRTAFAS